MNMNPPMTQYIRRLFRDTPKEQVKSWASFLIEQGYNYADSLKDLSEEGWARMRPNIPMDVSEIIKKDQCERSKNANSLSHKIEYFFWNRGKNRSGLSSAFQPLSLLIKNQIEFKNLRKEIQLCTQLEEIVEIIQSYMGSNKAKHVAASIYRELNKDQVVYRPIDIFEAGLRKEGMSSKDISNIRQNIEKGRKMTVRNILHELLGNIKGQDQYKIVEKLIVENISKPIEESEFIGEKNGFRQFKLKQKLLEQEKASAKTLIVFGETGCGKSTFLNTIVNYIAGVEMEDTFRYIVIVQKAVRQTHSLTKTINDYYIKNSRTGVVYRLIDTPGFGDTEGGEKDKQLIKIVEQKFKNDIQFIHCILFVLKSSINRLTFMQKYVFQNVMDLFNKEIARNFVFIFTFSDSGQPQVLQFVKDQQSGFGRYWSQLAQPRYIQVNNCAFIEKNNENDRIMYYWKIGVKYLDKLFQKIDKIEPTSLYKLRSMLQDKQSLNKQIIETTKIIQQTISKRQNIKAHIKEILFYRDKINNNKNFTYQVQEDQWYDQEISKNVTRCNTAGCFSKQSCHIGCYFKTGLSKRQCTVMDESGKCKKCGCPYTAHTNSTTIRKVRRVTKTVTDSEIRRKYEQSYFHMRKSEAVVIYLLAQLKKDLCSIVTATEKMNFLQNRLKEVKMSERKAETMKEYLQHLIQSEKRKQEPNYLKRIKGYQEAIKQIQLSQAIRLGEGPNKVNQILMQIEEDIKKIIESVQPGFFQRIKKRYSNQQ